MSSQPRRSPRLLAAEWKANAVAYYTHPNASHVPAGPPNTFVSTQSVPDSTPPPSRSDRLAAKMVVTQSVVTNPSVSTQPRRSVRLAAKMIVRQPAVTTSSTSSGSTQFTSLGVALQSRFDAERKKKFDIQAYTYMNPLFIVLDHTHDCNFRLDIITRLVTYLNINPEILIWNPRIRATITQTIERLSNQLKDRTDIDRKIVYAFVNQIDLLKMKLTVLSHHPDYVS